MAAAPMRWLPMRWLRLLLVAQWSVGFEEYEEMPSRWQAGKDGSQCAYAKPGLLPQAIRSRLAFFAFISMDEPEMLEHWLSWYGWLGAPVSDAARSLVVVHVPPGEAGSANAAATLAHLKAAGVSRVNETAVYSSRIKQTMVNDFIGRLPRDALLVYPDSDEFFAFPCDVEAVLAADGAVHGHMVERMASTWEFADVRPPKAAPIWDQFPLHCAVTAKHLGANHFKQMLTPMVDFEGNRVYYRSSHNVYCVNEKSRNPHPKHCVFRGNRSFAFGHYRFTRRAHALAEHKRDVYKAVLDGADTPEKAIADAADRDMLTYERTVVSQTWQYVMRLEFVKNPELIPSCLGPRRTAALKHHLKSTAVSSGVVPFRPPRAARLKASAFDKTDDAWLALAREVANYCECRAAEHKISQVPAACANHLAPPTKPARLAVAILSYLPENAANLAETVCHYAMVPRLVASVLVQWNNAKVPPPAFNCSQTDDKYVTTVTVVAYGDNTLLNRYRRPELMGDGSVLLQDDDVRYSHRALRAFASVASLFPDHVLGVFGRMALYSDVAPGVYMNPDKHGGDRIERQYNMLTGKTSVLDVATVASFFDDDRVPPAARDWIAQRHKPTCEDMTLHWHAATLRPNPPVWLQFSGDDALELDADLREPAADGHATGEMHLDVANWGDLRSQCVDRLHDAFGNAPLVRSMCRLDLKDYRPGPRLDAVKQKKSKVDQLAAAAALEAGARAMAQLEEYEPVLATQASQLGALVQSSSDAGFVADAATARADLAEALLARRDARYARARRILRALKLALDGGALAAAVLFVGVALRAVARRRAGS